MIRIVTDEHAWKEELEGAYYDWYHTWDYHRLEFLSSSREPYLFIYERDSRKIALPLLRCYIDDVFSDFNSVYGYPGFITYGKADEAPVKEFIGEFKNWCQENNIVSVFTRLNNVIFDYDSIEPIGETVVLDLNESEEKQRSNYRKNNRNIINKLIKDGYTCSWDNSDESLHEFIRIYNETMDTLNASDMYYFDESYFSYLLESEDFSVRIYNCHLDGNTVCSGLFVYCNDIVQYHLSGTLTSYKRSAPNRLMLDTVRRDASNDGYKVFHLGGGIGGCRDGLFDFKYSFSKKSIDFKVLKLITNNEQYIKLSNISSKDLELNKSDFFPLYRKS